MTLKEQTVRTRFAPSPTGFMHVGNLRTALYAYYFAKSKNGHFIIRIEDTDRERFVEGAIDKVYYALDQCNVVEDESPRKGGEFAPYVQSARKNIYQEYANKLVEMGGAYLCFCDKKTKNSSDSPDAFKYDKHCANLSTEKIKKNLEDGVPYVIRQNIPLCGRVTFTDLVYGEISVDCADLEDNILIKSDGMPTYNFANVIDDHLMQITHVIRGAEYLSSTPKYNLLYQSFGWEIPQYIHLPAIMKDEHHKLSKRNGDANLEDFISKGYLPAAIANYITLLGWNPGDEREKMTMSEMISSFSIDGLSKSASIFDENKMKWLNGLYVRELTIDEFYKKALPVIENSPYASKYDPYKLCKVLHTRVEILSEIPDKIRLIDDFSAFDINLFERQKLKATKETAIIALSATIECFKSMNNFDEITINAGLTSVMERESLKKGQVLWSVRVALTGRESTPGGACETADILGQAESLRRLEFSISLLNSESKKS
jgi:glutamyl-tRNA synthetase